MHRTVVTNCQNAACSLQQDLLCTLDISSDGWNCYFIM